MTKHALPIRLTKVFNGSTEASLLLRYLVIDILLLLSCQFKFGTSFFVFLLASVSISQSKTEKCDNGETVGPVSRSLSQTSINEHSPLWRELAHIHGLIFVVCVLLNVCVLCVFRAFTFVGNRFPFSVCFVCAFVCLFRCWHST